MFQAPPEDTKAAVSTALETGYRHINTARIYRNEEAVGALDRGSRVGPDPSAVQ